MGKVTELLKQALATQKRRFFLSEKEREFIADLESLLEKEYSDSVLIHKVGLRLNLLINQFNLTGKHELVLESLIPAVLNCKMEIIRDAFKFRLVDFDDVDDYIQRKKFDKANKMIESIFDYQAKRNDDRTRNIKYNKIGFRLFENQNLRIVLTGSNSPGCTSCIIRYTEGKFVTDGSQGSTVGADFSIQRKMISDQKCRLMIWDTATQERFRVDYSDWYSQANAFIFVFNFSDRSTFDNMSLCLNQARNYYSSYDIPIFLIGNGLDLLKSGHGQVTPAEAKEFARLHNFTEYFECSAKTGEGVDIAFDTIAKLALNRILEDENLENDYSLSYSNSLTK